MTEESKIPECLICGHTHNFDVDISNNGTDNSRLGITDNLEYSNSVDIEPGDREYEVEFEIELDCDEPVVCPHCGRVSEVADPSLLTFFETDPVCQYCGMSLEVVL